MWKPPLVREDLLYLYDLDEWEHTWTVQAPLLGNKTLGSAALFSQFSMHYTLWHPFHRKTLWEGPDSKVKKREEEERRRRTERRGKDGRGGEVCPTLYWFYDSDVFCNYSWTLLLPSGPSASFSHSPSATKSLIKKSCDLLHVKCKWANIRLEF